MSDQLLGPTSHSYYSQRLRLHYVDWGNESAPPLLLVHGGRDHCRNWDWVARALRDDYHVIAPDLRDEEIVSLRVSTARTVQPILDCDYQRRMPSPDIGVPGVWIANSSQCYQGPIHINLIIAQAQKVSREVVRSLGVRAV